MRRNCLLVNECYLFLNYTTMTYFLTNEVIAASSLKHIINIAGKDTFNKIVTNDTYEYLSKILDSHKKQCKLRRKNKIRVRTWDEFRQANTCRCTEHQPDMGRADENNPYYVRCVFCDREWAIERYSNEDGVFVEYNLSL